MQRFRNLVRSDRLSKTFDNCGLTNTGLADKNRIVLGTTAEDLHDAFGFARTTDNRIEFLFASELGEVATELIENCGTAR